MTRKGHVLRVIMGSTARGNNHLPAVDGCREAREWLLQTGESVDAAILTPRAFPGRTAARPSRLT